MEYKYIVQDRNMPFYLRLFSTREKAESWIAYNSNKHTAYFWNISEVDPFDGNTDTDIKHYTYGANNP